jgi:hypothetical protein
MSWPVSNPIAREMDDFWKECQSLWQQWWNEADLDTKMMTGQQDYWNTFYNINYRNQKILMFNKILRIQNMIDGYQRDNRLATIVVPADNDPDLGETADQLTTVLGWVKRQDQTYEKISDCFGGCATCGLNLQQVWMDFREDPENGDIRTSRIPFNAFLMDNYWTKHDLSDCSRIWTRRYLSKRQLLSLMPAIKRDLPALGKGYAAKDGKFQFLAQNWYQYQEEMYAYDEYWTKDYKKVRKLLDKSTGEIIEWKGTRDQFQMLRRINPNIELISASVPTIKWHILVNGHVVYEEKEPYGLTRFPFVPYLFYHFPEVQNYAYRYQGFVRNVRDSQIELNRRRNRLLDILDAQVQSGLMVKEDALVNPEDAFFQGPGKILYFKNSANLASDVLPITPPPVAAGWEELINSIEKEIMDIVGPEELFAQNMGAKDMTSALMKLKMGAGLIGLRNVFDRLNLSQMQLGDIFIELIQNNFGPGKIAKILGKEPTQEFYNGFMTKYTASVEEGELTSTQRQLKFIQAVQLKQLLGDAIPNSYVFEQSTFQGKKQVVDMLKAQEEQASKLQQMQTMQQLNHDEVFIRSIEAKAQNDFASAEERKARAVSNIGLAKERASQAVHDRASAALDNSKAIKELEAMDEKRLMELANFIVDLQMRQKQLEGSEEGDSIQEASAINSDVEQTKQETKPMSLQSA